MDPRKPRKIYTQREVHKFTEKVYRLEYFVKAFAKFLIAAILKNTSEQALFLAKKQFSKSSKFPNVADRQKLKKQTVTSLKEAKSR